MEPPAPPPVPLEPPASASVPLEPPALPSAPLEPPASPPAPLEPSVLVGKNVTLCLDLLPLNPPAPAVAADGKKYHIDCNGTSPSKCRS